MNYQIFEKYKLIEWAISIAKAKAKLELTEQELFNVLEEGALKRKLLLNRKESVSVDEIEFDSFSRTILSSIGYISTDNASTLVFSALYHKYEDLSDPQLQILGDIVSIIIEKTKHDLVLHLSAIIEEVINKYGFKYLGFVLDAVSSFSEHLLSSPYYHHSKYQDIDTLSLKDLFSDEHNNSELGQFFDQRYIDYLHQNFGNIQSIHWRKFEEMTAQFFSNEGFEVQIGPGRKDGGIDVIASKGNKFVIVQCKRWNSLVGPSTIKALHDDSVYTHATKALLVCLNGVSNDTNHLIQERKYKIEVITQKDIFALLEKYKSTI